MKANAPERIWMDSERISHFDCKDCITENSIEYIRTDAFIEKLECWMNENFYQYAGEFAEGILAQFDRTEDCIEDFKKYIEGE